MTTYTDHAQRELDRKSGEEMDRHARRNVPLNAAWAALLASLATPRESDPLLPRAMQWHPRFHRYLKDEEQRLALLQAECIRLCGGDERHGKQLAADVIWNGVS